MEDTVYRQAVLDALEWAWAGKTAIDAVKELPPAEPEQKWIPCSERMPDVRQRVLCQCRAGIMDVLRLTADGSWNKDYPHAEYMSGFVVAWMPLPEPYEGEC